MFKRVLLLGAFALSPVLAFAGPSNPDTGIREVTVQTGQGGAITVVIPTTAAQVESPYALSGESTGPTQLHWVSMQLGQGAPVVIGE